MGICIGLFVLSWAVVDRYSTTAAVIMTIVALIIPPFAAIVANVFSAADRRRRLRCLGLPGRRSSRTRRCCRPTGSGGLAQPAQPDPGPPGPESYRVTPAPVTSPASAVSATGRNSSPQGAPEPNNVEDCDFVEE
jgi:hypothetical protein